MSGPSTPRHDDTSSSEEEDLAEAIRRSLADLGLGDDNEQPGEPAPEPEAEAAPSSSAAVGGGSRSSSSSTGAGSSHVHVSFNFAFGCPRRRAPREAPPSQPAGADNKNKKPAGKTPCTASPGSPAAAPDKHSKSEHGYVVWANPADASIRGVHFGGLRAWGFIVARLPGSRYSYRAGVRLRRFEADADGYALYLSEATIHRSPVPAPDFFH